METLSSKFQQIQQYSVVYLAHILLSILTTSLATLLIHTFPSSEVGTPRYSKDLQRSHKYEINQRIQPKFSVNSAKFFSSLFFAEHQGDSVSSTHRQTDVLKIDQNYFHKLQVTPSSLVSEAKVGDLYENTYDGDIFIILLQTLACSITKNCPLYWRFSANFWDFSVRSCASK